ncbi:MAG: Jag N-terminal domain-containing protein, partial [Actinomycetia bacterium]|nr:Jag N-terminal domain-containing protein [Actinomycetes bacterium]
MNVVDVEGKTRKEAIEIALEKLGVTEDKVTIEDLDSSRTGIFGLRFGKPVKLRVMHKEENTVEEARSIIEKIYELMNFDLTVELKNFNEPEKKVYFNIISEKAGLIIGKNGRTLESVQLLSNILLNRKVGKGVKLIIDIDDYRNKKENNIVNDAKEAAEIVIKTGKARSLESMNPFERRLVHIAL